MVGFVHNHPDRPFVMGGMFHGGTGLGGGVNNHMRSIQTKSGIKVLMNDNEKSVTILDPSGNTYFMDGAGSITVIAPETMTLNSKNFNINVGENMTTSVGMNQSDTIGMNKTTSVTMNNTQSVGMLNMLSVGTDFITNVVGKMTEFITGNKESHTEKDRTRVANGKITTQSEGLHEHHSGEEVRNNSAEKSKNH